MKKLSPRGVFERQISEEDIVKQITQFLELNEARVHRLVERIPWGRKTSTPGMPDICGWFPKGSSFGSSHGGDVVLWMGPMFFFIEVKKPGGNRRPAQIEWIRQANDDGMTAFFAESVEDVAREFAKNGIKLKGL